MYINLSWIFAEKVFSRKVNISGKTLLRSGNAAPAPAALTALALAGESESLNGRCQTFAESTKRYFSGFSSVCAYSTLRSSH